MAAMKRLRVLMLQTDVGQLEEFVRNVATKLSVDLRDTTKDDIWQIWTGVCAYDVIKASLEKDEVFRSFRNNYEIYYHRQLIWELGDKLNSDIFRNVQRYDLRRIWTDLVYGKSANSSTVFDCVQCRMSADV